MLKFGFFDSVDGDRKYNSRDVAEIFDGIIADGIYAQIGERFSVNPKSVVESSEDQMTITVGTGQAWLSHTKVLNTSRLELTLSEGIGANRYDAIILEVNDNTRNVDIFIKSNVTTKTNNPNTKFDLADGQLVRTEFVHQYLLAVILVEGGASKITAANIASKIGFDIPDGVPYVTCPLDPFPADETLKQWNSQWYAFFNKADSDFKEAQQDRSTQFNTFMTNSDAAFTNAQDERNVDYQELRALIVNWLNSTETDWDTWYASVKDNFEGYVDGVVAQHNESTEAHNDMRNDIQTLLTRLNALADSDDETLDQLSEIVAYIKNNRDLIRELNSGGLTEEELNNALKNYLTKTDAIQMFLPVLGFDNYAGISCLGEKAFTLWVNGKAANIMNGFEVLNYNLTIEGNFWRSNGNANGPYIRNNTGYPVTFYVLCKVPTGEYIQYGRGRNEGSLPTYQYTGSNRIDFLTLSNNSNTDWQTFSYTVNNNETFFFGCNAGTLIKWIGADIQDGLNDGGIIKGDLQINGNLTAKNYPSDVSNAPITFSEASFPYSGDKLGNIIGYIIKYFIPYVNMYGMVDNTRGYISTGQTIDLLTFPFPNIPDAYLIYLFCVKDSTGDISSLSIRMVIYSNGSEMSVHNVYSSPNLFFSITKTSNSFSVTSKIGYTTYYRAYKLKTVL